MVRCLTLVTVMVVLAPLVAPAQSIEGVWRMDEREFQGGTNPRVESGAQVQPSLLIYPPFRMCPRDRIKPTCPKDLQAPVDAERPISSATTSCQDAALSGPFCL